MTEIERQIVEQAVAIRRKGDIPVFRTKDGKRWSFRAPSERITWAIANALRDRP